eukprot:6210856-Alexandrium_andersonii.AAC.1
MLIDPGAPGRFGELRRVPESSGELPESFLRAPENSVELRRAPESSGELRRAQESCGEPRRAS